MPLAWPSWHSKEIWRLMGMQGSLLIWCHHSSWEREEWRRHSGRILSSNLMLGHMIQPSWCPVCQWPGTVIFRVLHTDIVIVPPSRSCSFSLLVLPLVPLGTWWRNSNVMQINFWFLKITVCVWMFCLCENWTRVLWKSNHGTILTAEPSLQSKIKF